MIPVYVKGATVKKKRRKYGNRDVSGDENARRVPIVDQRMMADKIYYGRV
jgi:hypothetical protein